MFENFKKATVGPKIHQGVSWLAKVIISLSVLSTLIFAGVKFGFSKYRSTAIGTNLLGRIQANILEARLSAMKFIRTGERKHQESFEKRLRVSSEIIQDTFQYASKDVEPQLREVDQLLTKYNEGFGKIVVFKMNRNKVVYEELDKYGPVIAKNASFLVEQIQGSENRELV